MTAGSTLNVPAGEYSGSITIKKAGTVNFVGATILGRVTNSASNVTINNLTVKDSTLVGFLTTGSNVTVNNLKVYNTDEGSTGDADGVRVRGNTVKFNNLYINLDDGSKTTAHPDCVQFETWVGSASNITFDGMTCINTYRSGDGQGGYGLMIDNESTSWNTVTVRNSFYYVWRCVFSDQGSNFIFENNTCISVGLSANSGTATTLGFYSASNTGVIFQKNILVNFYQPVIVTGNSIGGYSNIVYCGTPCRSDSAWSHTNQLWDVNPKLDANYVPMTGSPAILSNGYIGAFDAP